MKRARPGDSLVYFVVGAGVGFLLGICGSIAILEVGFGVTLLIGAGAALVVGVLGVVLEENVLELLGFLSG
jgi:hypothetical protein